MRRKASREREHQSVREAESVSNTEEDEEEVVVVKVVVVKRVPPNPLFVPVRRYKRDELEK